MTALIDTLFQLEKYLGLELDSLLPYAEADTIGGFHPDPAQRKWDMGAIFDVEGRALYAVIMALRPQVIIEIGSGTGCSANHMAAALLQNYVNPATAGHITTIDRGNTPHILDQYKTFVTAQPGEGIEYLAQLPDASVDFILEDADHTTEMCHAIGELAKTKLKPGGVLMAHDAAHWAVGQSVRAGYDLAGLDIRVYLTDPSDCGWAVWKRPKIKIDKIVYNGIEFEVTDGPGLRPVIDFTVLQAQEDYPDVVSEQPTAPPAEKVKRTRKPKAKSKP